MKYFISLLITVIFVSCTLDARSQDSTATSYNLDFLTAKYQKKTNEIIMAFKYSQKEGYPFKLMLSMKLTYSLGDQGSETTEILDQSRHSIGVYNRGDKKPRLIYDLIKDKVDLNQKEDFVIVVFYLRGLTREYVNKMTFTYGLWENENKRVRIERKYNIAIAP